MSERRKSHEWANKTNWQIRENTANIPKGTQQRSLQQSFHPGKTNDTSSGHQRASEHETRHNDETNDGNLRNNGGIESQRSDEMDSGSQQYTGDVRRSDLQRNDLCLTKKSPYRGIFNLKSNWNHQTLI